VTRGIAGSEPAGVTADVFYVLAMYARPGGLTIAELHQAMTREDGASGDPVPNRSHIAIRLHTLADRNPPLVCQSGAGHAGRWRITAHGYRMLATWAGEDDEPPIRPCGLGWPGAALVGLPAATRPRPGHLVGRPAGQAPGARLRRRPAYRGHRPARPD
jgi:hypothetical protein